MKMRKCAVSIVARYDAKDGPHIVHDLDYFDATSRDDADGQARAAFFAKWETRGRVVEIIGLLVEPLPK